MIIDAIFEENGQVILAELGEITHISDGEDTLVKLIEGSLTEINSTATRVRNSGFRVYSSLESVTLPYATEIKDYAFQECPNLERIYTPMLTTLGASVFLRCRKLAIFDAPLTSIDALAFKECYILQHFVLRNASTVCALLQSNTFTSCYFMSGTKNTTYNPNGLKGWFYVPSVLLESYKTATNWTIYASQFRALEDYTVDGTVTGALDESKI